MVVPWALPNHLLLSWKSSILLGTSRGLLKQIEPQGNCFTCTSSVHRPFHSGKMRPKGTKPTPPGIRACKAHSHCSMMMPSLACRHWLCHQTGEHRIGDKRAIKVMLPAPKCNFCISQRHLKEDCQTLLHGLWHWQSGGKSRSKNRRPRLLGPREIYRNHCHKTLSFLPHVNLVSDPLFSQSARTLLHRPHLLVWGSRHVVTAPD